MPGHSSKASLAALWVCNLLGMADADAVLGCLAQGTTPKKSPQIY